MNISSFLISIACQTKDLDYDPTAEEADSAAAKAGSKMPMQEAAKRGTKRKAAVPDKKTKTKAPVGILSPTSSLFVVCSTGKTLRRVCLWLR